MPETYRTAPRPFERCRCFIVRRAATILLNAFTFSMRLLPGDHPVRIYWTSRVQQVRTSLLPAIRPASDRRERAELERAIAGRLLILSTAIYAADALTYQTLAF